MHVVMIGGTGHVVTYLVPRLMEAGFQVTVVTRGKRQPYTPHGAWQNVRTVLIDRDEEEKSGSFGQKILDLKPDAVIDMICFKEESARHLVEVLRGHIKYFLHCGTVWVHGKSVQVPITEEQPHQPIGIYGTQKAAIEAYLLDEARFNGFPVTCIHPGHIVGMGWVPLNPQANFNTEVYTRLARGEELSLPNQGTEIVHHVHADDVAQVFMKALLNWNAANGESFHAVSPAALTLRGYAESIARRFGKIANLKFLPWEEWCKVVSPSDADDTRSHLDHNPNCYSIVKAQRLLNYQPRYNSLEAVFEALNWLITNGIIKTGENS